LFVKLLVQQSPELPNPLLSSMPQPYPEMSTWRRGFKKVEQEVAIFDRHCECPTKLWHS